MLRQYRVEVAAGVVGVDLHYTPNGKNSLSCIPDWVRLYGHDLYLTATDELDAYRRATKWLEEQGMRDRNDQV